MPTLSSFGCRTERNPFPQGGLHHSRQYQYGDGKTAENIQFENQLIATQDALTIPHLQFLEWVITGQAVFCIFNQKRFETCLSVTKGVSFRFPMPAA
jgi:hypothetical protein